MPISQTERLDPSLLGNEPESLDPYQALTTSLTTFRSIVDGLRDRAVHEAEDAFVAGTNALSHIESTATPTQPEQTRPLMRVVMMGRTMAGKSSLLAALTDSHQDRIGDGRQRFSRDVLGAAASAGGQIEVVDTPGVGAQDGADDTEMALDAARTADVILWVNSSDSIQQESATTLKYLAAIGKPIIVVINCRQSLGGVGELNLLRFPNRVFGDKEGLVDEIKRHLADVGVQPLAVVRVHALAASQSFVGGARGTQLRDASRIDDLTAALQREHDANREIRRTLRLVDRERAHAHAIACSLEAGAATFRQQAEQDRASTEDAHARLQRVVRATGEKMESDIEILVGRRRDWHLKVTDFGKSLEARWFRTLAALRDELQTTLQERLIGLADEIKSTIEEANTEWAEVAHEQFHFRELSDPDAVWGNRILRAGVGIGGAAAMIGIGALAAGPVGFAIAAVGSPVLGAVLRPLKRVPDRVFQGKAAVLRKRRGEVGKQVGPILDDLAEHYRTAIGARLADLYDFLSRERARDDRHCAALDRLAEVWADGADELRALLRKLDRDTASALLRIGGCEDLASSVKKATRVPGVCILVEFEQSASVESLPANIGERLAGGSTQTLGSEPSSAVSYVRGLVDAAVEIVKVDNTCAVIRVDADVPSSVTRAWSEGLSSHVGKQIQIESSRRTRTP
ncbi:GTPase [uncultured Williamsia sp.]|uniref:GTPase domain-containing protein n=1 Tax=uncultured Williamsia sp. TaxID=259311 RepID=UPI00260640C0|nr:GTPase [uncultured Williamsia sp.]